MLRLDQTGTQTFIQGHEVDFALYQARGALSHLLSKTGPGNEFLGWLDYCPQPEEIAQIKAIAREIQATPNSALVVVGIGGSYLGAKAALEALTHSFHNQLPDRVPVYFAGHNISGDYLSELSQLLMDKEVFINVISKSGTTTEPALAFRLLKRLLAEKFQDKAASRIIATTDKARGALRQLADEQGYRTFVIPDNIGGRFSVFTPVGLLPMAVAGIDIQELLAGAWSAQESLTSLDGNNPVLNYAAIRSILYRKGKLVEMLVGYEPRLQYLADWWKQLYGESEGKDGKGLFPASAIYSTDLHSLGQYVQDGMRFLFETVIWFQSSENKVVIPQDQRDDDGLNYLSGKTLHHVNEQAFKGTLQAHIQGGVPNMILELPCLNPFNFGYLLYFFMLACAVSGYMLGVNPFDQPGVEAYKKNMFALLGK